MSEPVTRNGENGPDMPETRHEPMFNLPPVVTWLIVLCAIIHVVSFYILDQDQYDGLLEYAAFIPNHYSRQFGLDISTFTSPVTYAFLHGSPAHIAINMIWLAAFGSPLAYRLGTLRFLAFWVFTAFCAVLLHYLLHMSDQSPLIGASGAISGMMGAAARFGFQIDRTSGKPAFAGRPLPIRATFRSRAVVTFLAVWMVINLVTGLFSIVPGAEDDSIAWEAHVGGFLAGFLCIRWFDRPNEDETA